MSSTTYGRKTLPRNIFLPTISTLRRAAEILRAGGNVAFPTETVYGLGADACNDSAIRGIYSLKGRPANNPLIVHCASREQIEEVALIEQGSKTALRLERLLKFMPGSLSVILPKHPSISMLTTADLNTVAVRIPAHPVALALIREAKLPVAAPSANPSNYISPTTAQHVADSFSDRIPLIIDGGPCAVGIESTVLSLIDEQPSILRPGSITIDMLSAALGEQVLTYSKKDVASPGQLALHYAPRTKCALLGSIEVSKYPSAVGLIQFANPTLKETLPKCKVTATLSESGSLTEAANKLYAILREFDEQNLDLILIEPCALDGIGAALMDRINRATANVITTTSERERDSRRNN